MTKKTGAEKVVEITRFMRTQRAKELVERLVGKYGSAIRAFPDCNANALREMVKLRLYWDFSEEQPAELDWGNYIRAAERRIQRGLVASFQDQREPVRSDGSGFDAGSLPAFLSEKQFTAKPGHLAHEVLLALREVTDALEAETLACWVLPPKLQKGAIPGRVMTPKARQFAERVVLAIKGSNGEDTPAPTSLPRPAQALFRYLLSE